LFFFDTNVLKLELIQCEENLFGAADELRTNFLHYMPRRVFIALVLGFVLQVYFGIRVQSFKIGKKKSSLYSSKIGIIYMHSTVGT
jgi:hypothetical protein